jgi:hypothetical protein
LEDFVPHLIPVKIFDSQSSKFKPQPLEVRFYELKNSSAKSLKRLTAFLEQQLGERFRREYVVSTFRPQENAGRLPSGVREVPVICCYPKE